MKSGSLILTFAGNRWDAKADDPAQTHKSGSLQVKGDRLILINEDGSIYQNWKPELNPDGQSFQIIEKQLIETFSRLPQQ